MAAGLIMVEPSGRFLVLRRAGMLVGGGKWNLPGGHVEDGEPPLTAAFREAKEEAGFDARGFPVIEKRRFPTAPGYPPYEAFVVKVPHFVPCLNWENTDYQWVTAAQMARLPLFPLVYGMVEAE
jgi:8-oxo-dGTP pyrophosphatase MutT (NUDIX family)